MKFSKFFAPTSKEAPKDAVLKSHILLSRAGYIMQQSSGIYNYLPLGYSVIENIKKIVNKHMQNSGANYLNLSYATDANLWKKSGRYYQFGDELLRFLDRKENEYVLAPTHEESMVDVAASFLKSYKQLPINLYQITSKFRDEARPRFGLMRAKEFIMKDAYSFHSDEQSLDDEFLNMQNTYCKILEELNLDYRIVEADSGAIGGSGSREFMVLSDAGEDDILLCTKCSYAANVEAAKRAKKTCASERPEGDASKFKTPNIKSIEELSSFFKVDSFYMVKAIVKKAIYENEQKLVVFFVRGCDELEETKAKSACKALELIDIDKNELKKHGLIAGFIGPIGLVGVDFYIDNELENEENMICGANEIDYHLINIKITNFNKQRYADLIKVQKDDNCPHCGNKLDSTKGIEVGHIFKLGTKYSSSMNATYLDENGKTQPYIMGCYGIGVSRLLAVLAQTKGDDKGLVFDKKVAPFYIDIIIQDIKDNDQTKYANDVYKTLCDEFGDGLILLDDRNERIGAKLKDYELIGIPYALVVGKNYLEGKVELINRATLEKELIDANDISKIINLLK